MRAVFGRWDWVANGALFTLHHLHEPWVMPATLVEGIFLEAYPSRRFQYGQTAHGSFGLLGILPGSSTSLTRSQ